MTLDYTFDRQLMLEREEARTEGYQEGKEKSRIRLICKKMQKEMNAAVIADILEEESEEIVRICNVVEKFDPDYDSIYEELHQQTAKGESPSFTKG